jgi:hypothetical protein
MTKSKEAKLKQIKQELETVEERVGAPGVACSPNALRVALLYYSALKKECDDMKRGTEVSEERLLIIKALFTNHKYMGKAYFAGYEGQITGSSTLDTALMVVPLFLTYALNLVLDPIGAAYDKGRNYYSRISQGNQGYPMKMLALTVGFLVSVSTYAFELVSCLFKFTMDTLMLPVQVVDAIRKDIFSALDRVLPEDTAITPPL